MDKKPYLTEEEEKELVSYVINCAKMGYNKTRKQVVEGYIYMKSKGHKMSTNNGW